MGEPPKAGRLVLKLARTGSDQWAVAPGSAPPPAAAASPSVAPSSSAPAAAPVEVKSEPKEEKNGRLIIRLKAPGPRKPADEDSDDDDDDGANKRKRDDAPSSEAKRQRRPSANAPAGSPTAAATPVRTSQREVKPPSRGDDTSSHRDEDDDEIEVSGGSVSGGSEKADRRPVSTVMIPLRKAMSSIIAHLIKKDYYGVFYDPVDPDEVHDYYDVIKRPMCFKTIRKKLQDDLYPSLKALEEDVELICSNAMIYNPPGTVYHEEAKKILAESKAKFIDYAPRTVSTLPPKKQRDHKSEASRAAATGVGATAGIAGAVPGSSPIPGASPALARVSLPTAANGASRPPMASPLGAAASAVNAALPPPGRRYAAPTQLPQRKPPLPINSNMLPSAGVAPGTTDAKATYAYNPAVPGKPTGTPFGSTASNYINAPTRTVARPVIATLPATLDDAGYQTSVEAFMKGANSPETTEQVKALLNRLKNPPPLAAGSAALAEVLSDVRSHPHSEVPPPEDIEMLVNATTRDFPGIDLSFLLRAVPSRGTSTDASAPAKDDGGDRELQRELDRNYESLVRLYQMHHQRPSHTPAQPAPAETALSHALSLSLALLSSKLPLDVLHPVAAAVPTLTTASDQQLPSSAPSPAPQPSAMETTN